MTNSVIASFAEPSPISVERRTAGGYSSDTGAWVPGTLSTISMTAAVLTADSNEVKQLNAGQTKKGGIVVYTDALVRTATEQPTKLEADVILWDSRRWQVKKVAYRGQLADLAHYRAVAIEEDVV